MESIQLFIMEMEYEVFRNDESTISSVICKIDRQIKTNSHLQKKVDQIKKKMNKGQKQT